MIIYFADRRMNVLGHAATSLPDGFVIMEDLKTEEIETGVATFSCRIGFTKKNRAQLEAMTNAGNYLLRSHDNENEFYTIIDTEIDTKNQNIYVYAEDAGLDLINEVVGEFEATEKHNAEWYINQIIVDSGFEIGINEIPSSQELTLAWEGEASVTSRLASIATKFGGYEVSYSFDIKGLEITRKYIHIHKERGKDVGVQLRLDREIDRIVTTKSVANLATAFVCEGGVPDDADQPITFTSTKFSYDDGDFFVDGNKVKSRKANEKWSRYVWNKEPNRVDEDGGYIVRPYSYDTTDPGTLCSHAIAELKKVCDMEVNYEIDITKLPEGVKIGDRINIVDDAGGLYVSTRVLLLETSVVDQKYTATLGEHLIKTSGISQKVLDLAEEFAKTAKSAERALEIANTAKTNAGDALKLVDEASGFVAAAQAAANNAIVSAQTAVTSANEASGYAKEALDSVANVNASVAGIEKSVEDAQAAAANAQTAASTATSKATEATTAAQNADKHAQDAESHSITAKEYAEDVAGSVAVANSNAAEAKQLAEEASTIAAAAKLDAKQAEKDVKAFGENLGKTITTIEADYARKTELTETTAHLEKQIIESAGLFSRTLSLQTTIDETANNAATLAEQARLKAEAAQEAAEQAQEDATKAQTAAEAAQAAADAAQREANTAAEALATAQAGLDTAKADLEVAEADLATVLERADATEAEIAAAREAVNDALARVDAAQGDVDTAKATASEAQDTANTAVNAATLARMTADNAEKFAESAKSLAKETAGAYAAQIASDEAAAAAKSAQEKATKAEADAVAAQTKATEAATAAATAQSQLDTAKAELTQAQNDLSEAESRLSEVTSKVGATEQEIAAAKTALAQAQADVNAAKSAVATAQSTADTAKANADTAQSTANNAKNMADAATAQANAAKTAADKAQADVESLKVRVKTCETNITQTQEAIKLTATKTEVANAVNAIQVGGRIILRGTGTAEGWTSYSSFDTETRTFVKSNNTGSENYIYCQNKFNLEKHTQYTISFKAKHDLANCPGLDVYILPEGWTSTGIALQYFIRDVSTEYKQYSHTFTPSNNASGLTNCELRFDNNGTPTIGTNHNLYIRDVKLEKGTKATDWTPAPEDVDAAIGSSAESLTASLTTTAEGIVAEAVKDYTKTSEFGEYKSSAASEFKVLADGISGQVTATETRFEEINGKLQQVEEKLSKYFSFDINGLTIGQEGSKYRVVIDNDRFSMMAGEKEVLWLDAETGEVYAPKTTITEEFMLLGYRIKKNTSTGNVDWDYVGG